MEGLDDTPSIAPIARRLGERRNGKDKDFLAAHEVNHGERKLLWVDPASSVFVGRTDVREQASNLDGGFDFTGETVTKPLRVLLVVRCLGLKLGRGFRVEASRSHLRLCRTRAKSSSAGTSLAVPASTSAIRF